MGRGMVKQGLSRRRALAGGDPARPAANRTPARRRPQQDAKEAGQ